VSASNSELIGVCCDVVGWREAAAGRHGGEPDHHSSRSAAHGVWTGVRVLHQPDPQQQPGASAANAALLGHQARLGGWGVVRRLQWPG
jgi:hypothetical protein